MAEGPFLEAEGIVELGGQLWRGLGHHPIDSPYSLTGWGPRTTISQPRINHSPSRFLSCLLLVVHYSHHHLPPFNPLYS